MDIIYMAYIIYIAAEKTPPPLPQGGGTIWRGGVGVPAHIYLYIYIFYKIIKFIIKKF